MAGVLQASGCHSRRFAAICIFAAFVIALGTSGCTVWAPNQNPHKFKDTTNAEQYERIFWTNVRKRHWKTIRKVLGPNVVYTAGGAALQRDQIIPYLKSLDVEDFLISNAVVKPNGADMTLTYNIQLERRGEAPVSLVALSVWQQLRHGMILIAHSQQAAIKAAKP